MKAITYMRSIEALSLAVALNKKIEGSQLVNDIQLVELSTSIDETLYLVCEQTPFSESFNQISTFVQTTLPKETKVVFVPVNPDEVSFFKEVVTTLNHFKIRPFRLLDPKGIKR